MKFKLLWRILPKLTLYPILCFAWFAHAQANDPEYVVGKSLFLKAVPACAICHTLNDAQSEGSVGPVLDEIKPNAQRVAMALRNGLGNMPPYSAKLSDSQIQALARYVSKASGGAP